MRGEIMTGSKDQRTGWLKELKVGDYVFVKQYRGTLGSVKTLAVVDKITPTGRINIGVQQFQPSGERRQGYKTTRLEQATKENIKEFTLEKQKSALIREIAEKVNGGVLAKMDTIDLKEIKMTLDKYKK